MSASKKPIEPQKKSATAAVATGTLEPAMRDRIVTGIKVHNRPSIKWPELMHLCGPKAKGELTIQLDALGSRCHHIKVWYGVSQEFHDAIQKLREENVIRLIQASPVGYFPATTTPPLPITHDYKIGHTRPHLFLTVVELMV